MQNITAPLLQSINMGVTTAYNTQFWSTTSLYKQFTFDASSTGEGELYPRLDQIGGLREWIGARVIESLSQSAFAIPNKTFEKTIGVKRENVEDDKYGFLTAASMQLGLNAARFPDLQIAALIKKGNSTPTYDGQNFFDASHPNPNADGTMGTVSNYQAGSGDPWFLFDTSQVLMPFIWQTRRPFVIIPKFSLTDERVFWDNEFVWGVDGRCNAGFGLWQLAYMSKQPLNVDNLTLAFNSMENIRRADGAPMGISPTVLMTTTSNFLTAKALMENDSIPAAISQGSPTLTSGANYAANTVKGLAKPLKNPWIN